MGKKKGKQILMPPLTLEWPKVDKEIEDKILTALIQKLQEFPRLVSNRRENSGKKSGQPAATVPELERNEENQVAVIPCPESNEEEEPSAVPHVRTNEDKRPSPAPATSVQSEQSEEEKKLKARLRQQVLFGHRQVTKALESNQLALVLVSGEAQPPILLRSLLPLVARHRCAAACMSSLSAGLRETTGLDTVLALGIKKTHAGEPSDFEEFVSMAAGLAPPVHVPWIADSADGGVTMDVSARVEDAAAEIPSSPAKDGQLMEADQEKEVTERLMGLLKPYKAVYQQPKSKLSSEELQRRKTLNACLSVDVGALRFAASAGQLELLLVHHDPDEPNPNPHPALTAAVRTAREKSCPVLHMATLRSVLVDLFRQNHLRAVGFKKTPVGAITPPEEFQQFVAMACRYDPSHLKTLDSSKRTETGPGEVNATETGSGEANTTETRSGKVKTTETGSGKVSTAETGSGKVNTTETSSQEKKKKKKQQKPVSPTYDVSSLYVYKTDAEKDKNATRTSSSIASEAFISLSSEPTVQYLGVKPLTESTPAPDIAFLDVKGSGIPGRRLVNERPVVKAGVENSEVKNGADFSGVMGLDCVDSSAIISRPSFDPEELGRKKVKVKAGLKRALDQSAERGEFVSFKVSPTCVQVSMPNPNKKRNKKFKKK
ncbi:uncharacterized protein LOC143275284 isoform X2 [Babylonia areolata]|uniref:uncharacterized protein LOC143275284 isoform X2 n=1 Tax=Babylonia areolata TaxID=304850 RepID=UPI003FD4BB46